MATSPPDPRFGELSDLSFDWYWCLDEAHRLTSISPADRPIVGHDPLIFVGRALWELGIDQMSSDFWAAQRRVLDAHQPFQDIEIQLRGPEQTIECFSFTGRPRFDAAGAFIGYHGLARHVTDHVRTLNRLREAERQYRTLVELSPDAILIYSGWNVAFVNSAAIKLLGAGSADELIGRPFLELIPPRFRDIVRERARRILYEGRTLPPMEQQGQRLDGSVVDIEVKSAPAVYGGKPAIQVVWRDITERKAREAELHRLTRLAVRQEELERANRAKSQFLAAASHDLRQPVHAFGLLLEALRSCMLPSEAQQLIVELQHAFDSMDALLNALLDISRLDAGVVTPAIEDVPIVAVFDALRAEFTGAAHAKSLALRIRSRQLAVRSDPRLLSSILSNLVSNAVRYTERGRILVGCRRRGDSVSIEVWDTGIGIPADKHQEVFQEFVQLHNPSRDRSQGLGLGLAIVERTAKLLGHTVSLRSQVGRGTVFRVLVPLGALTGAPRVDAAPPTPGKLSCSVLVVDDEAPVRTSIAGLLNRWGCEAVAAESGDAAEHLLRTTGLQPDVLLTDYRLRDAETGLDVIARLRAILGDRVGCALITGDTAPGPLQAAEEQGIRLLHKPVRPRALRMLLDELLTRRDSTSQSHT